MIVMGSAVETCTVSDMSRSLLICLFSFILILEGTLPDMLLGGVWTK